MAGEEQKLSYADDSIAKARQMRDEQASHITDPVRRMKWIQETDAEIDNFGSKLHARAAEYDRDKRLTDTLSDVDADVKSLIVESDPDAFNKGVQNVRNRLAFSFERGDFKTYSDYQKAEETAMNAVQLGRYDMITDLGEKRQLLNDFKSGKIENKISADTMITMETQLRAKEDEAWAVDTANKLVPNYGKTNDSTEIDRAMTQVIRTEKDPDKQKMLISQLSTMRAANNAAVNERQDTEFQSIYDKLNDGSVNPATKQPYTLSDFKGSMKNLTAQQWENLKTIEHNNTVGKTPVYSDAGFVNQFMATATQGGYSGDNLIKLQTMLRDNASLLSKEDYKKFDKISRGQEDLWNSGLTEVQEVSALFSKGDGISQTTKNQVVGEVGQWRSKFIQGNGRPPTTLERQQFLDAKKLEIVTQRGKLGTGKSVAEMWKSDQPWTDTTLKGYEMDEADDETMSDAVNYLIKRGMPVDQAGVQSYFDRTPEDRQAVTDTINWLNANNIPFTNETFDKVYTKLARIRNIQ